MRRTSGSPFCFAVILAQITLSQVTVSAVFAGRVTIEVPTASATAEVGLYGRGLCLRQVETGDNGKVVVDTDELAADCSSGSHDFRPIDRIRIVLLAQGHGVVTDESGTASRSWKPELTTLPTFQLRARISPPPPGGASIAIDYSLIEAMSFFNYIDGSVPRVHLGSADVDSEGRFGVEIPDLRQDPFITSGLTLVYLRIQLHGPASRTFAYYSISLEDLYSPEPLLLDESKRRGRSAVTH